MFKPSLIAITLALGFILAVLAAGEALSHAAHGAIGAPPADLPVRSVSLPTPTQGTVSGWFVPGRVGGGAVLLLHGVRSDRRQMVGRARFLHRLGYGTLLIDLPSHGESGGGRITFGYREAEGVHAALQYLAQAAPNEKIAVIGVSMGAAAFVFSKAAPAPGAVVLESMYPSIEEAVSDRLKVVLGEPGVALTPLLLSQLPLRLGLSAAQLRPIDAIPNLGAPVMVMAGSADTRTTLAETQRLYRAAVSPKSLRVVQGAGHVDLYDFDPQGYEAAMAPFLARYLRDAPPVAQLQSIMAPAQ